MASCSLVADRYQVSNLVGKVLYSSCGTDSFRACRAAMGPPRLSATDCQRRYTCCGIWRRNHSHPHVPRSGPTTICVLRTSADLNPPVFGPSNYYDSLALRLMIMWSIDKATQAARQLESTRGIPNVQTAQAILPFHIKTCFS